jgi:hypothetical protein
VVGRGRAWNSEPGAIRQPLVQQPLRQAVGVLADVDPAEQALRRRREAEPGFAHQAHGAARAASSCADHAFGVAAQRALVQAQRQRVFQRLTAWSGAQQLGVDEALRQLGRGGDVAHAPLRRQDLGEARDVDRAPQAVQLGQPRGVGGASQA